jgi:hypothetical protein
LIGLGLAGLGWTSLWKYENESGASGPTPVSWPRATQIELAAHRDTLVMFAHPQCPCTRASLEELARLVADSPRRMTAQVWFYRPANFPANWTHSDLWRMASAIPGVIVHDDPGGAQAKLFGAETSGYVLLYDEGGALRFRGGITPGRGRAGDSEAVDTIVSLLDNNDGKLGESAVYGCSLFSECRVAVAQIQ